MSLQSFEWQDAKSLDEAAAATADKGGLVGGTLVKAGGLDLLDLMKERIVRPARLVNIRNVAGLDGLTFDAKAGLKIGALVTLARLEADANVKKRFSALAEACGHAATPQIRNAATLGGNLMQRPRCWYFRSEQFVCRKKGGKDCPAHDGENQYLGLIDNQTCAAVHASTPATALLAYDARLELVSTKGARSMALADFFVSASKDPTRESVLQPGELIREVVVPTPAANVRAIYVKQTERESYDWPLFDIAALLEMDGTTCKKASIVMGSVMANMPMRMTQAEQALAGKKVTGDLARAAADAAFAGATPLSKNGYKLEIAKVVLRRALLSAAGVAA